MGSHANVAVCAGYQKARVVMPAIERASRQQRQNTHNRNNRRIGKWRNGGEQKVAVSKPAILTVRVTNRGNARYHGVN